MGEAPGVEDLHRHPSGGVVALVGGLVIPGFGPACLPGFIADKPARLAKVTFEHHDATASQGAVRSRRHPEGLFLSVVSDMHGDDVLARHQIWSKVVHVVVEPPELAADRATTQFLAVDEQDVARVGGDSSGNAVRCCGPT